jgi:hypothetical protein
MAGKAAGTLLVFLVFCSLDTDSDDTIRSPLSLVLVQFFRVFPRYLLATQARGARQTTRSWSWENQLLWCWENSTATMPRKGDAGAGGRAKHTHGKGAQGLRLPDLDPTMPLVDVCNYFRRDMKTLTVRSEGHRAPLMWERGKYTLLSTPHCATECCNCSYPTFTNRPTSTPKGLILGTK